MKFGFSAALAIVAVAMAPQAVFAQDAHDTPILGLAADGVTLTDAESGESGTVGFGTSQDDAVEMVGQALGSPEDSGLNEECGAGPLGYVNFQGGLTLLFAAGEFAGWSVSDDSGFATSEGLRVGASWGDLTQMFDEVEGEETSIGYEFTAGGYNGVLTEGGPDGQVATFWAGTSCIFR